MLCLAVYLIAIVVSSKQTIILEPYAVLGINEAVITFTAMIRWKKA